MTEREKQLIEDYIPSPPDPTLDMSEYYFKQYTATGARIIRVFALDVLCRRDGTEYGLYQEYGTGLRWVDGYGQGDRMRGVRMNALYDNKQDCKDETHMCYDNWEYLRELQKREERGT